MVTIEGHTLSIATHTMSIILLQFTSFVWLCRKNLTPWNTLKIQLKLLQSIHHYLWDGVFVIKDGVTYPCIHACMCKHTIDWNKKSCLYFFFFHSFKIHSGSGLCLKLEIQQWTWWSLQSSSQPANFIHNFNVTTEISALTQAWC